MKISDFTKFKQEKQSLANDGTSGFMQSIYPHIRCNHSPENINDDNYGYCFGITKDSIPFEAELWYDHDPESENVTIYIPEIEELEDTEDEPLINAQTGTRTFSTEIEIHENMALCVGMVDNGQIESLSLLNTYIELLIDCGLIQFPGNVYNAAAWRYIDMDGNDIIAINVTLCEDGEVMAMTHLKFTPFTHKADMRAKLKVVKSEQLIYGYMAENLDSWRYEGHGLYLTLKDKKLNKNLLNPLCRIIKNSIDSGRWIEYAGTEEMESLMELVLEQAAALMPLTVEDYYMLNEFDKWQEEFCDEDNPRIDDAIDSIFLNEECRKQIEQEARNGRYSDLAAEIGIRL